MKTYEPRPRPPEVLKHIKTTCDFCGFSWQTEFSNPTKFRNFDFHIDVYCSMIRTEYDYTTELYKDQTSFDMCPDCFTGKFLLWAQSLGAKPTIQRLDTDDDENVIRYQV